MVDLGGTEDVDIKEKLALLLVGRLVTDRSFNIEAFKRTMTKVWAPTNNLVIRVIGPNLFAFQFFHWRDKEIVLNGRPWCFENHLLILKEVEGDEQPEHVSLTHSPFWIRVCKLPFNCRSNNDIKAITAGLGEFMEIEDDVLGLDRFRRIRLMIDVSKPLRRYQRIKDKKGKEVLVEYKYERLPYFCFACGIIGHSEKDCLKVPEEEKKKTLGWNIFLRASPRKGHTKVVQEVNHITTNRRKLFVTKELNRSEREQESDPKNLQMISTGASSEIEDIQRGHEPGVQKIGEEAKESDNKDEQVESMTKENNVEGNEKELGSKVERSTITAVGVDDAKLARKPTEGKKWKREERSIKKLETQVVVVGKQKRNSEATNPESEDDNQGAKKRSKIDSSEFSETTIAAEVGGLQPRRDQ